MFNAQLISFRRLVLLKTITSDFIWLVTILFNSSAYFFMFYRLAVLVFDISCYFKAVKREKDLEPYRLEAKALSEKMSDNSKKRGEIESNNKRNDIFSRVFSQ
ncbi:hypothetical protein PFISCL1PPCAC_8693 [Pristionchus fissidentatus]|uniref:G protein-coupled receptor n=1 Tax=Pristionchus fissidentatus TaxID=1538716 RepID=A0AAV5VDD0_9BILA|nr:hypothetical protein PFISCL1PPCAC_8693 [Pristionchus fissidentatus]